jgi:hypothetical protein
MQLGEIHHATWHLVGDRRMKKTHTMFNHFLTVFLLFIFTCLCQLELAGAKLRQRFELHKSMITDGRSK